MTEETTMDPGLLIELALAAANDGRLEEASEICARLLEQDPADAEALHLLGVVGFQGGVAPEQALDLIERAIAVNQRNSQYHNSRGALLYGMGRDAEAEASFRAACTLRPEDGMAWNNLGNSLLRLDRVEEAETAFRQALLQPPVLVSAINNLGLALRRRGQLAKALICFREAVLHDPTFVDAHFNCGDVHHLLDQLPEAEACFREALRLDPACAPAYASLAQNLRDQQRSDEASAVIAEGLRQVPGDEDLAFAFRLQFSGAVPAWHIPMINDDERNFAYDRALARAVRPGDLVLEIGTGSGLVALMAARAGAGQVVTCEVSAELAETAAEIVTRNGYADRITVINRKSTQLRVGEDLPEKADLFVSELVNVGMLAPNMIQVIRHARASLLKPEGRIVPEAATVYGALMQCDHLARINPVREIAGFDMSPMDRFRTPGYVQVDLGADPHRQLSDRFVALSFDFRTDLKDLHSHRLTVPVVEAGTCHGVAFWFDLHLFEDIVYHSQSTLRTNHWKQAMHFFSRPVPVRPGDRLDIIAGYDNTRIYFSPAG